jgi:hypothetical protein
VCTLTPPPRHTREMTNQEGAWGEEQQTAGKRVYVEIPTDQGIS